MALSGSVQTSVYTLDGINFWAVFEWTATQSIENNTSKISWSLKSQNNSGSSGIYVVYSELQVKFDGEEIYHRDDSEHTNGTNGKVLASGTATVQHNSDGTKSLDIAIGAGIYNWAINRRGSGTITLNTIPRATTPVVSGNLSLGSTITINTSSRASSSFTHNLYYTWGSGIVDALIASGVTTSKSWTIPKTLAEAILAGTTGTLILKCVTYSGSTAIGTKTLSLTVSVPDTAEFRPTIQSITAVDANNLPINAYVVGKTRLKFTISAVGGYVSGSPNRNSFPVKAVVTVEGVKYNITLGQSASSTFYVTTNLLTKYGALYATVTVTDSRERTATMSFAYTSYDYFAPVISSFTARRCLADGTLSDSGTYILCNLVTTVASVNNLNAKTYKIVYENNGSEVTIKSGTLANYNANSLSYNSYSNSVSFSVDNSWNVRVYVYDSFNSDTPAVVTVFVPTEATFMDWRYNGKGIAFGKVSTKDGFESGWPMYDQFDTKIGNGLAVYSGSDGGRIDPNTTTEHLILTNVNTPTTAFWYILTMFYSTKSDTANRVQIAYMYNSVLGSYTRYYYNGSWSDWIENPMIAGKGTSGIWNYIKYATGEAELWGTYTISSLDCNVALGGLYRTNVFSPDAFPFTVTNPKIVFSYESDGYGAFPWATTATTTTKPPSFYLIRPTSATIASGKLNMRIIGKWK